MAASFPARHVATNSSIAIAQLLIEETRFRSRSAARRYGVHAPDMKAAGPDEGQDVALANVLRRLVDLDAIEAYQALLDQPSRQLPRLNHPGAPEILIEARSRFRHSSCRPNASEGLPISRMANPGLMAGGPGVALSWAL